MEDWEGGWVGGWEGGWAGALNRYCMWALRALPVPVLALDLCLQLHNGKIGCRICRIGSLSV